MNFAAKYAFVGQEIEEDVEVPDYNAVPSPVSSNTSSTSFGFAAPSFLSSAIPSASSPSAASCHVPMKRQKVRAANVNVLSVDLSTLAQDGDLMTGDPVFCSKCSAGLSVISKLVKQAANDTLAKWTCEFCNHENEIVALDSEEIPKSDTCDYVLEPATSASTAENVIIFCIDISGSMCVTKPVPGKFNLRGDRSNDISRVLKESIGLQRMRTESANVTYVSRLQCVQAAINSHINELHSKHPNSKVAIITFNREVTIVGDGTGAPITITGDKLNNKELLLEAGRGYHLTKPLSETKDALIDKLFALEEGGPTALGPAVCVAVGMAEKYPGATVVLATDGLSNTGVGAMDKLSPDEKVIVRTFYQQLGAYAQTKSQTINIVSIQGEEVNLDWLGEMAAATSGEVTIVDPLKIREQFAEMLQAKLIATNVSVKLIVHRGLKLVDIDGGEVGGVDGEAAAAQAVDAAKTVLTKHIGNAFEDSEITFEYEVRKMEEIEQLLKEVEQRSLAASDNADAARTLGLPFQVQITYTRPNGMKCIRFISRRQLLTKNRALAEKTADTGLIGMHNWQQSAKMAKHGDYNGAVLQNLRAQNLLNRTQPAFGQQYGAMTFQYQQQMQSYGRVPPPVAPATASSRPSADFASPAPYSSASTTATTSTAPPRHGVLPTAQTTSHVNPAPFAAAPPPQAFAAISPSSATASTSTASERDDSTSEAIYGALNSRRMNRMFRKFQSPSNQDHQQQPPK